MFFSAKQLYASGLVGEYELEDFDGKDIPVSLSRVKKYVSACKAAITAREMYAGYSGGVDLYKWFRPWDVVPELKNFKAPEGEYAVGVEVEACFSDLGEQVAKKIQHWKNVAIDFEGEDEMMEVTFPPTLYTKMSSRQQHFRYLKLLSKDSTYTDHNDEDNYCPDFVGIHVNVSKGGSSVNYNRVNHMSDVLRGLAVDVQNQYFGRRAYGYCNNYGGDYVEFKLFNSTTCSKTLRKYIHVAVALADIIYSDVEITEEVVLAALQSAHKKR